MQTSYCSGCPIVVIQTAQRDDTRPLADSVVLESNQSYSMQLSIYIWRTCMELSESIGAWETTFDRFH